MKIIHIMLGRNPGHLTQNLVRSELLSQRGVTTVSFEPKSNCLSIEYDPAIVNDSTLMMIMRHYGLGPEPASLQPGVRRADG